MEIGHRFSVAPMLGWTNEACRRFYRLLSRRAILYTEMLHHNMVIYNPISSLGKPRTHSPVVLQLGGRCINGLTKAAELGAQQGYDSINLNCGCPSTRVQNGQFGVILMKDRSHVRNCVEALSAATNIPITVKHRIGVDDDDSYEFVSDFVGAISEAGTSTFIVHARKALLSGINPKKNRAIPPLRYDYVYRLKKEYPHLEVIINGGIENCFTANQHLPHVDGVMLGRAVYHNPWLLTRVDSEIYGESPIMISRKSVVESLYGLAQQLVSESIPVWSLTRHVLSLYHGQKGSQEWKRLLSAPENRNNPEIFLTAMNTLESDVCS